MISRRQLEEQKLDAFTVDLFWVIESWVDSIGSREIETTAIDDRKRLEDTLRRGLAMRVSKLSLVVADAWKRRLAATPVEEDEWIEICLNRMVRKPADFGAGLFESMGSSLVVSDSPEVAIWVERKGSGPLFTYVVWWILGAWPDGQISVDFVPRDRNVSVVFQDPGHVHTQRENEGYRVLRVWSCLIDYMVTVEYHGSCVWPKPGGERRFEILLPWRPPTEEELDGPLPVWMREA